MKSMTGFGRATASPYSIELRAVNHRYLDITVKAPRSYLFLEEALKALLGQRLSRGKVEVALNIDPAATDNLHLELNHGALESYLQAAEVLREDYGFTGEMNIRNALTLPDVMSARRVEPDADGVTRDVTALTGLALDEFVTAREREGRRLAEDIRGKLAEIERLVTAIEERYPAAIEAYRNRLKLKMTELLGDRTVTEDRLLTETAIFADRMCADEETVRLRSHVAALRGMLDAKDAIGRKLDFQVQEMAREANTIGSKAQDGETSRLAIDLKAEIEKIREQVQNVE